MSLEDELGKLVKKVEDIPVEKSIEEKIKNGNVGEIAKSTANNGEKLPDVVDVSVVKEKLPETSQQIGDDN